MSTHFRNALIGVVIVSVIGASELYATGNFPGSGSSIETEVTIDQDKAFNGNITPGDASGFPITITRPGRYVLTSNIYVPPNKNGIEINANDVTINFNGFRLTGESFPGIGEGQRAASGIVGSTNTVTIQNGVIALFGSYGIQGKDYWVVENMRIAANSFKGVELGKSGRVRRNTIILSGRWAVDCSDCLVEGNLISDNGYAMSDSIFSGVVIQAGLVMENLIIKNNGFGIYGANGLVTVANNTIYGNNAKSVAHKDVQPARDSMGQIQQVSNTCSPACTVATAP
jgi:hypothetical protein